MCGSIYGLIIPVTNLSNSLNTNTPKTMARTPTERESTYQVSKITKITALDKIKTADPNAIHLIKID